MTQPPGQPVDLPSLASLALRAARDAGELLLRGWGSTLQVETKSSSTDAVTNMDRASERLIVASIQSARPDDGLLGEEGGERTGGSGLRWIIDPLDGTINYMYGLPNWAVSIAVGSVTQPSDESSTWTALAGVVHVPAQQTTYVAELGRGARRHYGSGMTELAPSDCLDVSRALIATGFSYDAVRRQDQGRVVAMLLPQVRDIRRLGAASIDLCLVADGKIDAFYESGLAPWDRAAGELIAREAGVHVTAVEAHRTNDPEPILLASCPGVATALESLIKAARN